MGVHVLEVCASSVVVVVVGNVAVVMVVVVVVRGRKCVCVLYALTYLLL